MNFLNEPADVRPTLAGWNAINAKIREWGGLDGDWTIPVAPHNRCGVYFNQLVLPSWKKRGDRNDYPAIFETHRLCACMTWRRSLRSTYRACLRACLRASAACDHFDSFC